MVRMFLRDLILGTIQPYLIPINERANFFVCFAGNQFFYGKGNFIQTFFGLCAVVLNSQIFLFKHPAAFDFSV